MSCPLDPDTQVVVVVEDPGIYTGLLQSMGQEFRDYLRDAMHQLELDAATRPPVVQFSYTPAGLPDKQIRPSAVVQVTRRFRDKLRYAGTAFDNEPTQPNMPLPVREIEVP